MTPVTPLDIDDLVRETEATAFVLTPPTTEEMPGLDDDLKSLVIFQEECERRLNNLTEGRVDGRKTLPEGLVNEGHSVRTEDKSKV